LASVRKSIEAAVDNVSPDGVPDRLQDYLDCISTYEREFKKWEGRVDKIIKRYRDDNRDNRTNTQAKFNILWSNVQTLVPACFARLPQPDVTRRFRDNDPVGRVAALILERALDFEVQHYTDYRTTMKQSVYDRFLGGRGTSWVRYEPHFKAAKGQPEDGVQVTEDSDETPVDEQLDYECAPTDYVHWKDFGHSVARTWEEVTKVWRKVYMGESAVKERFGKDIAKKIPYDATPEDLKRKGESQQIKKQACVYELWDKETGQAVWISKSLKQFLDERDDPLGLQDFFPCPRPLFATMSNESLVPVPDFTLYQDQANELDILSDRIDGLAKMLQLKGVYDGSADSSLARLFTEGENGTLMPVKNWAAFAEKGGLKGQIDVYDLTPLTKALETAQAGMEQVKQQVYEITGISDIIRGQTQASETATAQAIKGQYASLRLKSMQEDVARYATQLLQLKAQVICAKFSPQTIMAMAAVDQLTKEDQQVIAPALALLIGQERMMKPDAEAPNPLRSFRIEVAADTLVQIDEQSEKQDRMEMLTAFGAYLEKAAQVGAVAPQMVPLLIEVGKFGLTSFKIGKAIEGTFDAALDALKQQAMQPPQPDPAQQAEEAKAKAQVEKAQLDVGVAREKAQIAREGMQAERQNDAAKLQLEGAKQQQDAQFSQQAHAQKMQQGAVQHQQRMQAAMQPPRRPQ
jgi:hypothetical protein